MGTVSRPIKTAGTTTYVAEKAILGATAYIRAAEVDADLATLYTLVNGNLDSANLAAASIPYSTLQIGASLTAVPISAVPTSNLNFSTVETTIVSFASITTRGGTVRIEGSWGVRYVATDAGGYNVTLRVKRGVTTIHTLTLPISNAGTIPLPVPAILDRPAAGTYTYTITGQTDTITVSTIQSGSSGLGALWLSEQA